MLNALFLTDDKDTVASLADVFREAGFSVAAVETLAQARTTMAAAAPDVAVMDCELLGDDGLDYLEQSRLGNVLDLILLSGDRDLREAIRGLHIGAADYLAKPVDARQLRDALDRIAAATPESDACDRGVDQDDGFGIMHGSAPPMRRLFRLLRKVTATNMTVLLTGESGVGKELAARIVHQLSDRSDGPMVPVNCGAIGSEILESELFGHEKGSFTGASKRHVGFFERANGGTLFLDEITEMSPELQVTLLRVLETRRLRRVGGESEIPVDVRLVAATNRDPAEAVAQGALREDLYYRLAQFPLRVPALRERGDDVITLAERFLRDLADEHGADKRLSEGARELLRLHDWPGNVRELKNAIGRAYVLADRVIEPDDLPPGIPSGDAAGGEYLRIRPGMPLAEVERRAILATVEDTEGDKKAAAEALGISLKTLYTKLKKYRGE
jgi:DNA-binding NtrC family response regulator